MKNESFKHPIIGQEAIVPNFGLGRVESFKDKMPEQYIEVKPYICRYAMKFDPNNVQLVRIRIDENEGEKDGNNR